MQIIAFAGLMKVGKTFSSNTLQEMLGGPDVWKIRSFAEVLKDMYAAEFAIPRLDLDDVIEKEVHRQGIQNYADECKRENPYFFVTKWLDGIKPQDRIICDDARALQEWEIITKLGGVIHKVMADRNIRLARGWRPSPADHHISETDIALFSAETFHSIGGSVLYNHTNNPEDLNRQLLPICKNYLKERV